MYWYMFRLYVYICLNFFQKAIYYKTDFLIFFNFFNVHLKTYLERPLIKIWFEQIKPELLEFIPTKCYYSINDLIDSIPLDENKEPNFHVLIDTDSIHYKVLLEHIKLFFPKVKIISISSPKTLDRTLELIKEGYSSTLEVGNSIIDFYNTIRVISNNGIYMPSYKVDQLLKELCFQSSFLTNSINSDSLEKKNLLISQSPKLTIKQKQVCFFLVKGYSYKEIAKLIGVSTHSVNQWVKAIYKKYEVNSRSELTFKVK